VFVTDRKVLSALSNAKKSASGFLADAPLGVVVCGDEAVSDVWIEDCAIAAIIGQLTATSLGLGSCWIQMRGRFDSAGRSSEDVIRDLLELPATFRIDCVLAIGYPAEEKPPVPADKLLDDSITEL
jgi:nitroreductase